MDEYKPYPRYVFSGEHMALVFSDEERAMLPGWTDSPCSDFVCPMVAQFHGVDQVPHELRGSCEIRSVEEPKWVEPVTQPSETINHISPQVKAPAPKVNRSSLTVFERAELKRAKAEEYKKQRAESKAKKAAAG